MKKFFLLLILSTGIMSIYAEYNVDFNEKTNKSKSIVSQSNKSIEHGNSSQQNNLNPQWLVIKTNPSYADIYINNTLVHLGECSIQLAPGSYSYRVEAAQYHAVTGEVQISGKMVELNINLSPAYGSISISTGDQFGARIILDGIENIKRTPCTLEKVPSGVHTLLITKNSCSPVVQNITVLDGKNAKVNVDLKLQALSYIVKNLDYSQQPQIESSLIQKDGKHPINIEMIYVNGGTFEMGSEEEEFEYEGQMPSTPRHHVVLSDFLMAKTEVTQALWNTVMGVNPSKNKGGSFPVDDVSWNDALVFIKKLNTLTGKNYRLPTEAEWEYAAGGAQEVGTVFSGTDMPQDVNDYAWTSANSNYSPHPVATKKPNRIGLYDMSGNVWEWCSDWISPYTTKTETNPTGPSTGIRRAHRGGCWKSSIILSKISRRGGYAQDSHNSRNGFRLAMSTIK